MKSPAIIDSPVADARITLAGTDGTTLAQADLWWKETPFLEGRKIAAIGGFHAPDSASTRLILDAATAHLKSLGIRTVVGPMDQNTWKKHRFVIERNARPPFFLEPGNPAGYPTWWLEAGFAELSNYSSSIIPLDGTTSVPPAMKDRILSSGITIENLDPAAFDDELRAIHALSLKSFTNNFLYTPLDENEFLGAYSKIRDRIDPELVKLARRDGQLVGFVFGIPDLAAMQRGDKPALIVKTLAVDPASRAAGLGSVLVDELHQTGELKGYTEAIHALQHESNTSLKITGRRKGTPFRRYALFSKEL